MRNNHMGILLLTYLIGAGAGACGAKQYLISAFIFSLVATAVIMFASRD